MDIQESPKGPSLQPPELPSEIKPEKMNEQQNASQEDNQEAEANEETAAMFNDEDVNNLNEIFNLFDKEKTGKVSSDDLKAILTSLKREPEEALEMLQSMQINIDEGVSFDDFLALMSKIEVKIEKKEEDQISEMARSENSKVEPRTTYIQTDQKVLDFLKLLEEYRIKCENEGQYAEARKSRLKYEELLRKESI